MVMNVKRTCHNHNNTVTIILLFSPHETKKTALEIFLIIHFVRCDQKYRIWSVFGPRTKLCAQSYAAAVTKLNSAHFFAVNDVADIARIISKARKTGFGEVGGCRIESVSEDDCFWSETCCR